MPVPPGLSPIVEITDEPQIPELPRTGAGLLWYYGLGGLFLLAGSVILKSINTYR